MCISFCFIDVSKLSGFGGSGGGGGGGGGVPGWVLSSPTALMPPSGKKPLISSLFRSGPAVFVVGADQIRADAENL